MVSIVALQKLGPGFELWIDQGTFPVWSLHVLIVHVLVFFRYSGFLLQSEDMLSRLIGYTELPIGV